MGLKPAELALLAVLMLRAGVSGAEVAPAAVFLRAGEVCVLGEHAPMRCVTGDGAAKDTPKWAPDGQRIAYLQRSGLHDMLALAVVVDDQGSVLQRVPIGAIGPGNAINSTMNSVVGLRWIGARRVVVEGHLNPSYRAYVVLDSGSGQTVAELGDQALGAGFSADGMHWANVSGVPHFATPSDTTPTLEIDSTKVLVLKGGDESFASPPRWSDDGRQVAILIRRGDDGPVTRLALAHVAARDARVIRLPFSDARVELRWCAGEPCVMRQVSDPTPRVALPGIRPLRAQWWRLHDGAWTQAQTPHHAANPGLDARRAALLERVREVGGTDIDVR